MGVVAAIGSILMVAGTVLSALAAWGVLDFPSPLSRMHAATKSASLGLALIALGAGIAAGSPALTGVGVLVAVFLFLTAPISGHMLGRAAYFAGQAGPLAHDDLQGAPPSRPGVATRDSRTLSVWRPVALIVVWVILWRDLSIGTVLGGSGVALVVEVVRRVTAPSPRFRLGGLALFLIRYLGVVVSSNLRVAWEVITPRNDQINEAIVAVPLATESASVGLLVANAVSYTPGSLTIEMTLDPIVLYVHVLHFSDRSAIRDEVAALEDLVVRAMPQRAPA